jgi:hypothetical protein
VRITSTPPGAEVFLDSLDNRLGTSGPTRLVPAGSHVFFFRLRGHVDARVERTIARLHTQPRVHANLQALSTLRLSADDSSAEGATARVQLPDGTIQAHTITRAEVRVDGPPGLYTVDVTRQGYGPASFSASPIGGASASIRVRLTPLTGNLSIYCDRPEATVTIDGTARGAIRFASLPVGRHTVEVRFSGADPHVEDVTIQADTTTRMSVEFEGAIAIACEAEDIYGTPHPCPPARSRRDFIDGQRTFLESHPAPPGTHAVRVEAGGYTPWEGMVMVRSRESISVRVRLRALPGQRQLIDVRTIPPHATIQVDRDAPQPSPLQRVSLGSPIHIIRVAARGYESQVFACSAAGGAAPSVDCDLTVELRQVPSSRCAFASGPLSGQYRDLLIDPLPVGEPCVIGASVGEIVSVPVDASQSSSYCRYDIGPRRGEVLPFGRSAPLGSACGAGNGWGVIVRPPPPGFSYPRGAD